MPPLEELDAPLPCSAASVCWSSWPDGVRLFCCWNCLRAACVFGPIMPSTGPGSIPLSLSACCAWRTSDWPAFCDDAESCDWPYPPEALEAPPLLIADDALSWVGDDLYCSWLRDCCEEEEGEALLEVCDDLSLLAKTAVLETANAAMTSCASFMCIPFRYLGGRTAKMYARRCVDAA